MSFKFALVSFSTVLLLVCSNDPTHAQSSRTISQDRASDLYMDYDRIQSCPNCNNEISRIDLYGFKGQPWRDERPGGCQCSKKKGITWYNAYHHWPMPWSVLVDHGRGGNRWGKYTDTSCPRFRDRLDIFANVRLAPGVRKDSGYFGPECEPYGLLGKSRQGVVVGTNEVVHSGNQRAGLNNPTKADYLAEHNQYGVASAWHPRPPETHGTAGQTSWAYPPRLRTENNRPVASPASSSMNPYLRPTVENTSIGQKNYPLARQTAAASSQTMKQPLMQQFGQTASSNLPNEPQVVPKEGRYPLTRSAKSESTEYQKAEQNWSRTSRR